MRYRITNLTRPDDPTDPVHTANADINTVREALKRAAAQGERLYIRPVTAAEAR